MNKLIVRRCTQVYKRANQGWCSNRVPLVPRSKFPTQQVRPASTTTASSQASPSNSSHWPVTLAVSLLAFAAGLSIERRWSRTTEASSSKLQSTPSTSTKKSAGSADNIAESNDSSEGPKTLSDAPKDDSKTVKDASTDAKTDEAKDEKKDGPDQVDEVDPDKITKPELDDDDTKGWREFAIMIHEKYGEKLEALRELEGKHTELIEERDDIKQRMDWNRIDSQQNAEFFFENIARNDIYKGMIRDDEIVKSCPLNPPEGLFEEEIKPTVIRVLDDKEMTRSVIIQLDGKAPSGDEEQTDKQWDHVYDWVSDLTKLVQQSDQVSEEGFWTILFSEGWYKCGFPAYSFTERDKKFPSDEVKSLVERLKKTSEPGMERYRVLTDKTHLRPFSNRLGNCSTTATVYPGNLNDEGKPRKVQVLVDTGAEITIIAAHHVPKDVKILNTYPITVSGFGGGKDTLNKRVRLRMKLHGENEDNGIDIVTTAYVMEKTASGLGVELGTDVMKPLGPTIDIRRSTMHIEDENGKTLEAPLLYLREDDKIKEPSPKIGDSSASEDAPPEKKDKSEQAVQSGTDAENKQD